MKLQDRLPDGVTVDGKFYKMDFSFRNVLRMIDILDDNSLLPEARAYNAIHCLCKRPKNVFKVLEAVKGLLFAAPRKKDGQRVTDWVQDAGLIRAAFRQAYGIDLWRDDLHWIEFTELLNAIPEGNRYTEIVGIRAQRKLTLQTGYFHGVCHKKTHLLEGKWKKLDSADHIIGFSKKSQPFFKGRRRR